MTTTPPLPPPNPLPAPLPAPGALLDQVPRPPTLRVWGVRRSRQAQARRDVMRWMATDPGAFRADPAIVRLLDNGELGAAAEHYIAGVVRRNGDDPETYRSISVEATRATPAPLSWGARVPWWVVALAVLAFIVIAQIGEGR